jgi:hypothetical protein
MGKKKKIDVETPVKKARKGTDPFTFLNTRFDTINKASVKKHIILLIVASLVTKLLVVFITMAVFHSFIDYFDIGTYFNHAIPALQGQLPYVNYQIEYPILMFIPIGLALIPVILTHNPDTFVFAFQLLMVMFDILVVLCVYFIGLKLWGEKAAFYAGFIYATAFSTAYFVLTKSDAFPTLFLMVAILFTIYGMNSRGYISASLGFFVKIFPVIALPFMVLYNAKTTSIKQEIISAGKIFLLFCVILLIPIAFLNPSTLSTYLFVTGGSVGIYVNTATYTLYAYINDVFHLGISSAIISALMYMLMGAILVLLLYLSYRAKEKNPKMLVKLVLCAIFCLVFFTKFHSPQYIVWFTPLLALLVADDLVKIVLFYIAQLFAYIEFPLMFGTYYVNLEYVNPPGSYGWYLTILFFTLEYIVLLILMYYVLRPKDGIIAAMKKNYPFVIRKEG